MSKYHYRYICKGNNALQVAGLGQMPCPANPPCHILQVLWPCLLTKVTLLNIIIIMMPENTQFMLIQVPRQESSDDFLRGIAG